jgi:hypothetical protein
VGPTNGVLRVKHVAPPSDDHRQYQFDAPSHDAILERRMSDHRYWVGTPTESSTWWCGNGAAPVRAIALKDRSIQRIGRGSQGSQVQARNPGRLLRRWRGFPKLASLTDSQDSRERVIRRRGAIIMPDKTLESTPGTSNEASAPGQPDKKPRAPKEDGFCNPRDGRGPLRKCDDQHAKLPVH